MVIISYVRKVVNVATWVVSDVMVSSHRVVTRPKAVVELSSPVVIRVVEVSSSLVFRVVKKLSPLVVRVVQRSRKVVT